MPTNATIPASGRARYFRYLARRCVERPRLLLDGAKAAASPHIAYLDLAGGSDKSTIIFSSQRSGSTLLAEVLTERGDLRLLFEPFRGVAVGVSRDIARGRFQDPGSVDPALDRTMRAVLRGRIRNLWVDRDNTSRLPRGRVIKDCYATNLAPYLAAHFPEVPLVYLLRHPIATAHSVVSLGWPDELDDIVEQTALIDGQFAAQKSLIDDVMTHHRHRVPALVLRWCLENALPLRLLQPDATLVIFYETLLEKADDELSRVSRFLGERSSHLWSAWRPDAAILNRPSTTAWRDGATARSSEWRARGWLDAVASEEIGRALEILDAFGLSGLYGAGPEPLLSADQVLGREL